MPSQAPTTGIPPLSKELVRESVAAVGGQRLALMVYGSQARGSADTESDVDVLAVVHEEPGAYNVGRVAVTAYTPAQLHAMAQASSLFILHLKTEGIALEDPAGVLKRALSSYIPIKDFEAQRNQIRAAASVLRVGPDLFTTHGQSLGRLGVYLLRTALYLDATEAGHVDFDIKRAAAANGDHQVIDACTLKRAKSFSKLDLDLLDEATARVLSCGHGARLMTADELEARALQLSETSPHASKLIVNVLFGTNEIDYVGLALAPW